MPKVMMIQSGGFGDIITCAPIARYYHLEGYDIHWPAQEQYQDLLSRFPYVIPRTLPDDELDPDWLRSDTMKCLELATHEEFPWALNLADRGPHSTAQLYNETNQECKYRLSSIPFTEKFKLFWDRQEDKEDELYEKVVGPVEDYVLVGLDHSEGRAEMPSGLASPIAIEMKWIPGYTILDWYKIIKGARAIYSVESSFHCFIDGIVHGLNCPLYLLERTPGVKWTVSEYWEPYTS